MRWMMTGCLVAGLVLTGCGGTPQAHREVDAQGQVRVSGEMVDGSQVGEWIYTRADGSLEAVGGWHDDAQHGLWRWYLPNGEIEIVGAYAGGLRTGTWSYRYPDSSLKSEGSYLNDRQVGEWVYAAPGGLVQRRLTWLHGSRDGLERIYTADGDVAAEHLWLDGFKLGEWVHAPEQGAGALPPGWTAAWMAEPHAWRIEHDDEHAFVVLFDQATFRVRALWRERAEDALLAVVRSGAVADPLITEVTIAGRVLNQSVGEDASALSAAREQIATIQQADVPATEEPVIADVLDLPSLPDDELSPLPAPPDDRLTVRDQMKAAMSVDIYTNDGTFAERPGYRDQPTTVGELGIPRPDLLAHALPRQRFLGADGRVVDLGEFHGQRPVVLVILRGFAGSFCPYCSGQVRAMVDKLEEFEAANAEVVFIYPGAAASVPRFLDQVRKLGEGDLPPVTIALDVDLSLTRALGIENELARPTSLLIDQSGLVRFAYVGRDLTDRPSVDDLLEQVASMEPSL